MTTRSGSESRRPDAYCPGCPNGVFFRHVSDRSFLPGEKIHRARVHFSGVGAPSEARPRTGRLSAKGRPRFGKTHCRSVEAKIRRSLRRKSRKGRYRFVGTELLENVLDVGYVPLSRYKYHEARYKKAGRPFTLKQAWGFRLRNQRRFDLPDIVVGALCRIYSVEPVKVPIVRRAVTPSVRTARNRTRDDSVTRIFNQIQSVGDIESRPGLVWRLIGEVEIRRRSDPDYEVPGYMSYLLDSALPSKRVDKPTKQAIQLIIDPDLGLTYEKVIGGYVTTRNNKLFD